MRAPLEASLEGFASCYEQSSNEMMGGKLGLRAFDPATDPELITGLQEVLQLVETDMTIFFRKLAGDRYRSER